MTKYDLTLTQAEGQNDKGVPAIKILKELTLRPVWAKYEISILNTSAVMYTFQNLTLNLNMRENDKERLTLTYINGLT